MADVVEFAIEHEAWNVYALADGSKLRMRVILTRVARVGTHPDGTPEYKFDHAVMCQVEPVQTAEEKERDNG